MTGPLGIRLLFACVLILVAVYCGSRLFLARHDGSAAGCGTDRSGDASHVVMCAGMAAMFVPSVDPLPSMVWVIAFGFVAFWFAVRIVRRKTLAARRPEEIHHVLGGLAMVYMFAAMPGGSGTGAMARHMPGMDLESGLAIPVLAWVFAVYFLVHTIRLGATLIEMPAAGATLALDGPRQVVMSAQVLGSFRVVMGVGMSYMLVAMR